MDLLENQNQNITKESNSYWILQSSAEEILEFRTVLTISNFIGHLLSS